MKADELKDFDSVAILTFIEQLKQVYDSDGIPLALTIRFRPLFTVEFLATPLRTSLTPTINDDALELDRQLEKGPGRFCTFLNAVHCL